MAVPTENTEKLKGSWLQLPADNPQKASVSKLSIKKKNVTLKFEKPNSKASHISSSVSSLPKMEVKRVTLEAKRKLGDRKSVDNKRLQENPCKTLFIKSFKEAVQSKTQLLKLSSSSSNQEHVSSNVVATSNKKPPTTVTQQPEISGKPLKRRSQEEISKDLNMYHVQVHPVDNKSLSPVPVEAIITFPNNAPSPTKSKVPHSLFRIEADDSNSENPPAGPSQSDLDHWDMVADACADVLQKLDLKGKISKSEDKRQRNQAADVFDFSTDFEFEDWALSYSASQQNEWDEDDDSDNSEWMYVTEVGVQCSLSDDGE